MGSGNTVYIIGADREISRSLAALLASYGIEVRHFSDAGSFLELVDAGSAGQGCVLFDLDPPGTDHSASLHSLTDRTDCPPVTVLGTDVPAEVRQQVREAGAIDFIDKSLATAYLFTRLADLLPGAGQLPSAETSTMKLADGTEVTFRMMHPDDAQREQDFVRGLSERSRYLRFFSGIDKLPASVLEDFTNPDYPYSFAVIAVIPDGEGLRQIGVARYAPTGTDGVAEFAVVIADDLQGQGVATRLMKLLILAASLGGIQRLEGLILKQNTGMLALARKLGFAASPDHNAGPSVALYVKDLRDNSYEPQARGAMPE